MPRFKDPVVDAALAPHLQPGESVEHWAYGVKQPSILLMIPLFALAILPGAIAVAMLTKEYLLVLTDQRVLALRVKGKHAEVQEVTAYDRGENLDVESKSGAVFAHVTVSDESRPFKAKFHRAGGTDNRERAMEAARAIGATA